MVAKPRHAKIVASTGVRAPVSWAETTPAAPESGGGRLVCTRYFRRLWHRLIGLQEAIEMFPHQDPHPAFRLEGPLGRTPCASRPIGSGHIYQEPSLASKTLVWVDVDPSLTQSALIHIRMGLTVRKCILCGETILRLHRPSHGVHDVRGSDYAIEIAPGALPTDQEPGA
jgi:hypothetical protein